MARKPARPANPIAARVTGAIATGQRIYESAAIERLATAQAKLDAHKDAQREREITALESIAKSLELLARAGMNRCV